MKGGLALVTWRVDRISAFISCYCFWLQRNSNWHLPYYPGDFQPHTSRNMIRARGRPQTPINPTRSLVASVQVLISLSSSSVPLSHYFFLFIQQNQLRVSRDLFQQSIWIFSSLEMRVLWPNLYVAMATIHSHAYFIQIFPSQNPIAVNISLPVSCIHFIISSGK